MKLSTADRLSVAAMAALFVLILALFLSTCGCAGMPPVEFCYVHPEYGQVCVMIGGEVKRLNRPDLSKEDWAKVDEWMKTGGGR